MISIFDQMMNELAFSNFDIRNIEVHNLTFPNACVTDYSKLARKQHLLHLILSGSRNYYINGKEIKIEGQNVIFIPHGTSYVTTAQSINETKCTGIGISFDALLKNGEPLNFPQGIYNKSRGNRTKELFIEINRVYREIPLKYSKLKSLTLELISHLSNGSETESYKALKPAIEFIQSTFNQNLTVKEYADKCSLSESYFRKIFKKVMGISPIEYRNELRFSKAEQLYQTGYTLNQIAEEVGFCDALFLTRLYKKRFGISLKNSSKTI